MLASHGLPLQRPPCLLFRRIGPDVAPPGVERLESNVLGDVPDKMSVSSFRRTLRVPSARRPTFMRPTSARSSFEIDSATFLGEGANRLLAFTKALPPGGLHWLAPVAVHRECMCVQCEGIA